MTEEFWFGRGIRLVQNVGVVGDDRWCFGRES